jgi:hypothetical protein
MRKAGGHPALLIIALIAMILVGLVFWRFTDNGGDTS